jgi:hypothetical protein
VLPEIKLRIVIIILADFSKIINAKYAKRGILKIKQGANPTTSEFTTTTQAL